MAISFRCDCGKSLQVKDELAGRKVRCPQCKGACAVPSPPAEDELNDDSLQLLLADSPAESKPSRPPAWETAVQSEPPRPAAKATSSFPDPAPIPPKARGDRKPRREPKDRPFSGISVSPALITGLLMMLGAAVWFFGGLAMGYIFFYPPILFVLGLVSTVKGLLGHEE